MTLEEISATMRAYQKSEEMRAKEVLTTNYNIAYLTSSFVLNGLNGRPNPSIQELFPEMFADFAPEEEKDENGLTERERLAAAMYMEQMLDFAAAHNKKRHTAKEGEQN